jgi:hypothetical protein
MLALDLDRCFPMSSIGIEYLFLVRESLTESVSRMDYQAVPNDSVDEAVFQFPVLL